MYGVCDPMKADDFIFAIQEEWIHICEHVTEDDVARAKAQFKAAWLFQNDGTTAICDEIGRQMLTYGRRMCVPPCYFSLSPRMSVHHSLDTVLLLVIFNWVCSSRGWHVGVDLTGRLCSPVRSYL
jgi:hypothetical protein